LILWRSSGELHADWAAGFCMADKKTALSEQGCFKIIDD